MTDQPTPEQLREFAAKLVREAHEDYDFMGIGEQTKGEPFAGLTEDQFDEAQTAISDLISSAVVTVSWPDEQPQDGDRQRARTWLADLSENIRRYHQPIPGEPGHCACGRASGCTGDAEDLAAIATLEAVLNGWTGAEGGEQLKDERDALPIGPLCSAKVMHEATRHHCALNTAPHKVHQCGDCGHVWIDDGEDVEAAVAERDQLRHQVAELEAAQDERDGDVRVIAELLGWVRRDYERDRMRDGAIGFSKLAAFELHFANRIAALEARDAQTAHDAEVETAVHGLLAGLGQRARGERDTKAGDER